MAPTNCVDRKLLIRSQHGHLRLSGLLGHRRYRGAPMISVAENIKHGWDSGCIERVQIAMNETRSTYRDFRSSRILVCIVVSLAVFTDAYTYGRTPKLSVIGAAC